MSVPPSPAGLRFTLRVDAERNVAYMTQEGTAEKADMLRLLAEYEQALTRLRPGFILVNDQRGVTRFSDEALELGARLVMLTEARGVSRVIRLRPEAPDMRVRITRVLITARSQYPTDFASTPEEAEAMVSALLGGTAA